MPRSIFSMARLFVIFVLLFSGLTTVVTAQIRSPDALTQTVEHIAEPTPRLGEQRFNTNAFKVAHNAFERSEEYYKQLDDYNVWGLELDVHWDDNQFEIDHDGCYGRNLNEHISVMILSETWREKVTVLWLQTNDFDTCPLPSPDIYEPYLYTVIDQNFGWSHVYTPIDFKNIDGGSWPSWQEMVRRGKHLIIVTERTPHPDNDWFFEVSYNKPEAPPVAGDPFWNSNQVFFNTGNYRNFPLSPEQTGGYWASRIYPDRWCKPDWMLNDPAHETQGEWETHVGTHATQVATNCLNTDWENGRTQISRKVHPPQPTFVVPSITGARQLGTLHYPYQGSGRGSFDGDFIYQDGLVGAISRVSQYGSSTEVWIEAGDYETYTWEFVEFRGILISKPMVLKAIHGTVVIH